MLKPVLPFFAAVVLLTGCSSERTKEASAAANEQAAAAVAPLAEAAAVTPGFDCTGVTLKVDIAICADAQLAQLDVEKTRLYDLAGQAPGVDRGALQRVQGGWLNTRNACANAADTHACLVKAYVSRIHDLRADYPAARDPAGISIGPINWRCPGQRGLMSSTFINGDASLVYLKWNGRGLVLPQAISASGARYAASLPEGDFEFWNKGRSAMWTKPGKAMITCTETNG